MKKIYLGLLVFGLVLSSLGCEGKLQKMSNEELAEKRAECVRRNPTSPGRVTACENMRKECEARRKKGNYAC